MSAETDLRAASLRIAELEARTSALEGALELRSRQFRLLQRMLCERDLVALGRLLSGLPPLPERAYDPRLWHETSALEGAEVLPTMDDLWASLTPPRVDGGDPDD